MERFPGDYIRQQPEYRYLVYKDAGHVIQTCVEDGEVKLCFGHIHPTLPQDNVARLPKQQERGQRSGGRPRVVSHSAAYHLTTDRRHHPATSASALGTGTDLTDTGTSPQSVRPSSNVPKNTGLCEGSLRQSEERVAEGDEKQEKEDTGLPKTGLSEAAGFKDAHDQMQTCTGCAGEQIAADILKNGSGVVEPEDWTEKVHKEIGETHLSVPGLETGSSGDINVDVPTRGQNLHTENRSDNEKRTLMTFSAKDTRSRKVDDDQQLGVFASVYAKEKVSQENMDKGEATWTIPVTNSDEAISRNGVEIVGEQQWTDFAKQTAGRPRLLISTDNNDADSLSEIALTPGRGHRATSEVTQMENIATDTGCKDNVLADVGLMNEHITKQDSRNIHNQRGSAAIIPPDTSEYASNSRQDNPVEHKGGFNDIKEPPNGSNIPNKSEISADISYAKDMTIKNLFARTKAGEVCSASGAAPGSSTAPGSRKQQGNTHTGQSGTRETKGNKKTKIPGKKFRVSKQVGKQNVSNRHGSSCSRKSTPRTTPRRSAGTTDGIVGCSTYKPSNVLYELGSGETVAHVQTQSGSAESESEKWKLQHITIPKLASFEKSELTISRGTDSRRLEPMRSNHVENDTPNRDLFLFEKLPRGQVSAEPCTDAKGVSNDEIKSHLYLSQIHTPELSEMAMQVDKMASNDTEIDLQAPQRVDTGTLAVNLAPQHVVHGTGIDHIQPHPVLTDTATDSREQQLDSDSLCEHPCPVTRVDVVETRPPKNTDKPDFAALEDVKCTDGITDVDRVGDSSAAFTVPVIIVDEASTGDSLSEYSEDIDAVCIDADEYLALVQFTQSENCEDFNSLKATPTQINHKALNQLTDRLLRQHYSATSSPKLNIPDNPKLSEEKMPSPRLHTRSAVLRPEINRARRYSTPAALELTGLRKKLTPATYNVEFQSNTVYTPCTPRPDSTPAQNVLRSSSPRSSTPTSSSKMPRAPSKSPTAQDLASPSLLGPPSGPEEPTRGSLRSAMSSRRSSTASAGAGVHWEEGLSYRSGLSRQVSWSGHTDTTNTTTTRPSTVQGYPGFGPSVDRRRRHSSATHGAQSEGFIDIVDLLPGDKSTEKGMLRQKVALSFLKKVC